MCIKSSKHSVAPSIIPHYSTYAMSLSTSSYDSLQGVNKYKISTLALKIYDLITELDVCLDQWRETQPRISQAELEKICITIFRAHTECYILKDTGDWGRYLIMQGVVDTPASTCIVSFSDADLGITGTHTDSQIVKDSSKAEIAPTPQVLVFLKPEEMMPKREHIADAVCNKENLKTYKILDGNPPFTFLDAAITEIPEVYLNPWCPVLSHLRIIWIFIHQFLGLICKQFFSQQWCQAIDRLSPEDDAQHFLYRHCDSFRYLELSFPTYLQGFNHQCMHIDSEAGGLHTTHPPCNPFLTANKDELLYHAASLFEFEGHGELANCIHYAWGVRPILSEQAHVLFEQGFVEPIDFYDAEGRHCAFCSDELDLQYYDEVD
ncbi:hypothetical protein ARMGADRAFT_1086548 [Armillaria gallica]|uniref:Uncharacterized protein n=1 Tax=Armillaria gallica TaxID=47427 RepID=A0A2H3CTK8_ARMGA|nr:hypothetical protein ARMGADRAFT_1086548 [Armillaria gallica]